MKAVVRNIISGVLAAALCTGLVLLARLTHEERKSIACTGMEVHFTDSLHFVSKQDILGFINTRYGVYLGKRLDSLDLPGMERMLETKGAVLRSEAWTTDNGLLHISISQRAPVMMFRNGEKGFYIDRDAYIFPLHKSFTADVFTVYGDIPVNIPDGYKGEAPTEAERAWLKGMLSMNGLLEGSRKWKNLADSVSVHPNGDIVMRTSRGEEEFNLGGTDRLKEKFGEIEKYYDYIVPSKGEGYYKSINIKYRRQIICRQTGT